MRILFLGDIIGRPGRRVLSRYLQRLRNELQIQFLIANAENASGGIGLTPYDAQHLHESGIDVLTSGNHIWKHKSIYSFIDQKDWLLRPANFPPGNPGRGWGLYGVSGSQIAVINLQGRIFMESMDCPFRVCKEILSQLGQDVRMIVVDFHAEATSEKKSMLYFLDGKVSAVLGTHTHVQTNDALVSGKSTAYITDIGMCGPYNSIIGMEPKEVLNRVLHKMPQRFEPAKGEVVLQGVLMELDPSNGKARHIQAWQKMESEMPK